MVLPVLLAFLLSAPAHAIGQGSRSGAADFETKSSVIVMTKSMGCTGTLVAPKLVLTAAHCLTKQGSHPDPENPDIQIGDDLGEVDLADVKIYFGAYDGKHRDPALLRPADAILRYPGFRLDRSPTGPDLAFVRLGSDGPSAFSPAKLKLDPRAITPSTPVVIAGFGETDEPGADPDAWTLRRFETLVRAPDSTSHKMLLYKTRDLPRYREEYGAAGPERKREIDRAAERSGDSGGPAFTVDGDLVGVASGYNVDHYPTYTNLALERDWLLRAAEALHAPLSLERGSASPAR